jgi:hypothetical protein
MISRRTALLNILALGSVLGAGLPAFGEARRPSTIQKFDTDNDGTLDLNEVKKAAGALFDKLDGDHDGTLDRRELGGRLSAKEFAAASRGMDRMGSLNAISRAPIRTGRILRRATRR